MCRADWLTAGSRFGSFIRTSKVVIISPCSVESLRETYIPRLRVKWFIVKLAIFYNKDIAQSLQLKPNQIFLVNKYKTQAKGFKTSELRKIIQELENLDYKYKIGLIDLNVGLEAVLCRYCS